HHSIPRTVYSRHPSSFFPRHPSPPVTYTLSLHDALPICCFVEGAPVDQSNVSRYAESREIFSQILDDIPARQPKVFQLSSRDIIDRKSTRLNSSHVAISYAVFCLKKKKR